MAENYYSDNPDIKFHLENKINIQKIFSLLIDEEKAFFDAKKAEDYLKGVSEILENFGPICDEMASRSATIDKSEVTLENGKEKLPEALVKNLEILKSFGLMGGGTSTTYGGFGIPFFCEMMAAEMVNRACPSTAITAHWYNSIARVLEKYADEKLQSEYIPLLVKGEISGNMALTEPDAGSDLSGIKTYGIRQEDGTWKLYGTKRFITNGASEISLVLAKSVKGATGLDKLSLFLCPRTLAGKENIKVLKIEDKIGLHGSTTAELAFDGSQAFLLGKENLGFRYMLDLMNESRIGVALQALGLMEATFRLSSQYAAQRQAWGKPIAQHELIADKLLDMEVELKAARSLCYETVYWYSLQAILERRLKDRKLTQFPKSDLEKQLQTVNHEVRQRTPLIKYWLAEKAVEHARIGIQIHGGYGYMKEYRAEWLLREALIYPLYEGTSQIQALMCTKDTIKHFIRNPLQIIERTLQWNIKPLVERDLLAKKLSKLRQCSWNATLSILVKLFKVNAPGINLKEFKSNPLSFASLLKPQSFQVRNLRPALLQAERFCEIKCLEALGSSLVADAQVDRSRRWIAERFFFKALPRVEHLHNLIKSEDRVLNQRLDQYATKEAR